MGIRDGLRAGRGGDPFETGEDLGKRTAVCGFGGDELGWCWFGRSCAGSVVEEDYGMCVFRGWEDRVVFLRKDGDCGGGVGAGAVAQLATFVGFEFCHG